MAAAQALETTLRRNDSKPDWLDARMGDLRALLSEEITELRVELASLIGTRQSCWGPEDDARIQLEALDVAACALFIWAKAKGCPDFGHRGGLNFSEGASGGARREGVYLPE